MEAGLILHTSVSDIIEAAAYRWNKYIISPFDTNM